MQAYCKALLILFLFSSLLAGCDNSTQEEIVHVPDSAFLDGLIADGVDNMPMLTEACVWILPFPPEGIIVLQGFSPNFNFISTCSR